MPAFQKPVSATVTVTDSTGGSVSETAITSVTSPTGLTTCHTDTAGSGKIVTTAEVKTFAPAVVAKTPAASPYTVAVSDTDAVFATTGATGSATFNLPAVQAGLHYEFITAAAQQMVVSAAAGTVSAPGNAGKSTCTVASTAPYTRVSCYCDGVAWLTTVNGTATFA